MSAAEVQDTRQSVQIDGLAKEAQSPGTLKGNRGIFCNSKLGNLSNVEAFV